MNIRDLEQKIQRELVRKPLNLTRAKINNLTELCEFAADLRKRIKIHEDKTPGYGGNNGIITWTLNNTQYVTSHDVNPTLWKLLNQSELTANKFVPFSNDCGMMHSLMNETPGDREPSIVEYDSRMNYAIGEYNKIRN